MWVQTFCYFTTFERNIRKSLYTAEYAETRKLHNNSQPEENKTYKNEVTLQIYHELCNHNTFITRIPHSVVLEASQNACILPSKKIHHDEALNI